MQSRDTYSVWLLWLICGHDLPICWCKDCPVLRRIPKHGWQSCCIEDGSKCTLHRHHTQCRYQARQIQIEVNACYNVCLYVQAKQSECLVSVANTMSLVKCSPNWGRIEWLPARFARFEHWLDWLAKPGEYSTARISMLGIARPTKCNFMIIVLAEEPSMLSTLRLVSEPQAIAVNIIPHLSGNASLTVTHKAAAFATSPQSSISQITDLFYWQSYRLKCWVLFCEQEKQVLFLLLWLVA